MPTAATTNDTASDPRWPQVLARDPQADGRFWYSVATTGVYCRPSCPSRAANPANVVLHDNLADAQATGFRACQRCRPDDPSSAKAAVVAAACRWIEAREDIASLAELAAASGLSPSHFHRLFKRETGLTPRAYAVGCRAARLRDALGGGGSVTTAIYDAGYASSGRFYEQSNALLGMTPTRYKAGGVDETLRFAIGRSSLGAVLVASSDIGVAAILIGDDPHALAKDLQDRFPRATLCGGDQGYERLVARVVALVERPGLATDLPLDIRGTAFQQRVWQALRAIPAGQTASYAEVAARIGAPSSVRAVAGACAANSIAVAIPCHRVVRTDRSLSGYAWGVERKVALLAREAASGLPTQSETER